MGLWHLGCILPRVPADFVGVLGRDEAWEEQMSTAVSDAVAASGIPLHSPGRRSNNSSSAEFFFDLGPGVFWL